MNKLLLLLLVLFVPSMINAQYVDTVVVSPTTLDKELAAALRPRIDSLYKMAVHVGAEPFPYEGISGPVVCVPDSGSQRFVFNNKAYRFCLSPLSSEEAGTTFLQVEWTSKIIKPKENCTMYLTWVNDDSPSDGVGMMAFLAVKDAKGNYLPEESRKLGPSTVSMVMNDLRTIMKKLIELKE